MSGSVTAALPIYDVLAELLAALRDQPRALLVAPPGARLVLTLALAGAHRAQKPEKEKKPRPNIVNGAGSLKEKAKSTEGGHFMGYATPGKDVRFRSIAEVAESSSAVIIGTPQSNRCRLSEDETSITINYQVNVQEVIKGDIQPGSTLTVKLPGGKVTFADGTSAESNAHSKPESSRIAGYTKGTNTKGIASY